jgi:predicted MFS family arabinose efflux permease
MTTHPQRRTHGAAIALLADGTCTFVTGELLPVGLLSAISDDLHVSVGAAEGVGA